MTFKAIPHITWPKDGEPDEFILTTSLIYYSEEWDLLIQVEKGFPTDLASIPGPFRPLIPVNDRHGPPAILHDYLCRVEGKYRGHKFSRTEVDKIFLIAMKEQGVSWWKRTVMYLAVLAYGQTFQRF